jgi:hypothetical protein
MNYVGTYILNKEPGRNCENNGFQELLIIPNKQMDLLSHISLLLHIYNTLCL